MLLGRQSTLWKTDTVSALVLWVSFPSPSMEVSILRDAICDVVRPPVPEFGFPSNLVIKPLVTFEAPLPIGAVYVGNGSLSFPLKPSVWLNPFILVPVTGSCMFAYYQMALLRPDLLNWLLPLSSASVLVCDCVSESCECHASVLLRLLEECSSQKPVQPDSEEVVEELCPECDPSLDEADDDLIQVNETLRGGISRGVGYPSSWQKLIHQVRAAPQKIFWEIFAGCAILTSMFSEQGWHY